MKIRSDSLYATLGRLGHLDDFFAWYQAECPSYEAMREWLSERHVSSSLAAIHNLITYHLQQWRISKAIAAADAEALSLPENIDDQTRARIKALRLDLAMRDISVDQALALIRLDQDKERTDLAAKKLAMLQAREAKTRDVVADSKLSDAERTQRIKQIFGMA
jgi:hypothetical protein